MRRVMVGERRIMNKMSMMNGHKRESIDSPKQKRFIDRSHAIEQALVMYQVLPERMIRAYLSGEESRSLYTEGTQFQIGKIEMVTNTATYLDFPFHRFEDGKDMSEISLDNLTDLDGVLIRVPHEAGLAITVDQLRNYELRNRAVL